MLASLKQKIKDTPLFSKTRNGVSFLFHYIHKKFLWGLFSKIDEKFFKYLFVGALNTLFAYFLYALFVTVGLSANLSLFFQYILGVLWNFKTTGSIVFKNHNNKLLFKFILCYIITFFINSMLLHFLIRFVNEYIAQAILVLPVAIISFILFKFWVFNKSE